MTKINSSDVVSTQFRSNRATGEDPHYYTFTSESGLTVKVLRDAAAPAITGGIGGWQIVSRMRRAGLTQYKGTDPIRIDVPVLFDGWATNQSQETAISTLERMARPFKTGEDPPGVVVKGGIPRRDIPLWLVEDIDYSGQQKVIWKVIGGINVRVRQDCVVKLVQKTKEDLVQMSSGTDVGFGIGGASTANKRPKPAHPFVTYHTGLTLRVISGNEYGSIRWVRDIMQANGIRDANNIPDGTRLKMP